MKNQANATESRELPKVFSAKDIAEYCDISLPSAYELMRRDGFPAFRISPRRIVAPREAFLQWLNDQATKGGV